ncbi:MAG: CRISPR-associated helicase/endonuclease Cas3, partial [Xanthomonadales bacterium]|nr:CRISPR-associated helicase/endonuclease Cas3 [Xanthomonadales bacterium]
MDSEFSVFPYWGKADAKRPEDQNWHPLIYHMLDVAAVASVWWDTCPALRGRFMAAFPDAPESHLRAWVLFFIALHDLGKADIRFQLKAPEALAAAWRVVEKDVDHVLRVQEISTFDHGCAGFAYAGLEYQTWVGTLDDEIELPIWTCWERWIAAVTGHHGDFPSKEGFRVLEKDTDVLGELIDHDRNVRHALVVALESLFLQPVGLSLQDLPPSCSLAARVLLAGFCASCDWVGSNADEFVYRALNQALPDYLRERREHIETRCMLERYGLLAVANDYGGLRLLLDDTEAPRGIQTLVDTLPTKPGLTLIEAPTGSGKTEAALAYAWRLLAAGEADSIVFALPTQATANAMLKRVEVFAAKVYGESNVVLAHGKREFNSGFQQLVERGQRRTRQGDEEAGVQCAAWLASSRKRVFLGQIGVCTVDQVLLSVLPVRHKFVRGFGLNKSVLIVDEVHAYDAYMYGLLGEVLKSQRACGGSAILLSATLSTPLRDKLLAAWGSHAAHEGDARYPALWHATGDATAPLTVADEHRPARHEVGIECLRRVGAYPDGELLARIVAAGRSGALVAIVVNLVDDAQRLARALRELTRDCPEIAVDLFHARYRFSDRQDKEAAALKHYGREAPRTSGRILVATQVVEQSLDLDADFLITDLCPMDVLLQRIGRLHRHARPDDARPAAYRTAQTCVVTPTDGDLTPNLKRPRHGLGLFHNGGGVYADVRILQATLNLIDAEPQVCIPADNRRLVESATHPEALRVVESRDERWASHGQQIDGLTGAKKTNAKLGLLPFDRPFEELSFPDDIKLATRLGAADRVANFMPPQPGPFDMPVAELPIRFHLLPPGLPEDAAPEDIVAEAGGFRFRFGNARYRYSRFGLERLPDTT